MRDQVMSAKVLEKTRATITFDDGTVTIMEDDFVDTNLGRDYSTGWGTFDSYSQKVEREIKNAQELWGKSAATVRYERVTKTVQSIIRTSEKQKFYLERTVRPT